MADFVEGNTYLVKHPGLPGETLEMKYKGFYTLPNSQVKHHMFEGSGAMFTVKVEEIGNAPGKISIKSANEDPESYERGSNSKGGARRRYRRKTKRSRKTRHRRRRTSRA